MFYFKTRRRWLEYAPKKYPPVVIVPRDDWHAKRPLDRESLKPPVRFVLLNTDTGTSSCNDFKSCCKLIKRLQVETMHDLAYTDIRYNFLISDDGTIFEGRGWKTVPEQPVYQYHMYEGIALNVAYIGNYTEKEPPREMVQAKNSLLAFGVDNLYIHHKYEVIEVPDDI